MVSVDSHVMVTTEELRSRSETAREKIQTMTSDLEEITSLVQNTKNYWVGEAGDLARSAYEKQDEAFQEILTFLESNRVNLLQMAGIYEEEESCNEETAAALRTDLL
ncbi:MAG: WXG100 family type VII secretion target [Lachnospiraceae bacterium]|nr:WXG100 family type VII secretion target [Lachnospiraceae bacterium]